MWCAELIALLLALTLQVVAEGFGWVEGPLWVSDALESREYLLFSDVKANRLWKWEEGSGLFTIGTSVLLERSGCRYALLSAHLYFDTLHCEANRLNALYDL
jgi:sugar lactone lactonase YvrE